MAEPNWGLLQKSNIDSETIEEAIERIVAEHNADPESHLGSGESLQSHKASEIIDHLAESIIEDKIADGSITSSKITEDQIVGKDIRTAEDVGAGVDGVKMTPSGIQMYQGGEKKVDIPTSGDPFFAGDLSLNNLKYLKYTLQNNWVSLDGFTQYTTLSATIIPYMIAGVLSTSNSTNSLANLSTWSMGGNPGLDWDKNSIFQTRIKLSGYGDVITGSSVYFGLGGSHEYGFNQNSQFAVFYFNGTTLYAKTSSYVDSSYETETTELDSITLTDPHDFEIRIIAGVRVEYYIDGILVATHDDYVPSSIPSYSFFWEVKTNSSNIRGMFIFSFLFQQEY